MTETTLRRLPDGKWELHQTHDSLTSPMRTLDALADLGEQVAVELPKAEPWDGVFRVGDEGETRGGLPYRVTATNATVRTAVNGKWRTQPIESVQMPNGPHRYHNADGTFFGWDDQSSNDLMPPTTRGPKND